MYSTGIQFSRFREHDFLCLLAGYIAACGYGLCRHSQNLHGKSLPSHSIACYPFVVVMLLLWQVRNVQREVSRDADIVVAAMISIVGSTLIFQGWRLDPLLLLCQVRYFSLSLTSARSCTRHKLQLLCVSPPVQGMPFESRCLLGGRVELVDVGTGQIAACLLHVVRRCMSGACTCWRALMLSCRQSHAELCAVCLEVYNCIRADLLLLLLLLPARR